MPPLSHINPTPRAPPFAIAFTFCLSGLGEAQFRRVHSMSNSKKIASIAFTGAAATAATMMGVAPAFATSTIHVKNGGVGYTGPVKGKIKAGTTATLVDNTKNTTLTCKKMTVSGTISKSTVTVPPAQKIGVIKTTTWSSCTGPFGLTFKAHLAHSLNWVVSTANVTSAHGFLSGAISGKISGTGLAGNCRATISAAAGTHISWKYINAGHSLIINPNTVKNLHVKSAVNCLGAINASDTAHFKATVVVSVPPGLTIS